MKNSVPPTNPRHRKPYGESASSPGDDDVDQRRLSYETESISRRAAAPEITAKHLLAGCPPATHRAHCGGDYGRQ